MQLLRFDGAAGEFVEARTEGDQAVGLQGDSRRHRVAAVADQQIITLAQRGSQVEPGDAAPGPTELRAVASEDDGWAVELLEHTRGDNPHHPDVPGQLTFDDGEISQGVEP